MRPLAITVYRASGPVMRNNASVLHEAAVNAHRKIDVVANDRCWSSCDSMQRRFRNLRHRGRGLPTSAARIRKSLKSTVPFLSRSPRPPGVSIAPNVAASR